jgi:hypothetical protein
MVEVPSSRRGLGVRRITLGEENDSTEHKAKTLLERKVTAQGHGELQLLAVIAPPTI